VTGPKDPGNPEDADPREVDPASPTSFALPEPEQVAYDTGSDAWWRAQAQAAATDPPPVAEPAAPESVEGDGTPRQQSPSPLDRDWFPQVLVTPADEPLEPVVAAPVESGAIVPEQVEPAVPVVPVEGAPQAYAPPPVVAAFPTVTRPTPPLPPLPPAPPAPPTAPTARAAGQRPQVRDLAAVPVPEHSANRHPHDTAPVGRRRALAGAAIALMGVLLGVGALYLIDQPDDKGSPVVASPPRATAPVSDQPTPAESGTPSSAASTAPTAIPPVVAPTAPTASPAAAIVPVSVLNNSKITGLADRGAARFRAGGWPVKLTGNYRGGSIARTTVYYAPGGLASAQRFARQFGIARVAPRFPGLPTTGMTVLLTRDYR
jgi:hypothetical protein